MVETMEQYMSKTRTDYGSGVARPKIDNKYQFELKGQFFKELQENTFSGSDNEDANEHIEKVLKIVDLFHVPNITMVNILVSGEAYDKVFNHLDMLHASLEVKGGGYRATAPGYYQRNNANPSFQEQRQSMEDTLRKFMSESAKRHEENSNLIREIRASTDVAIRNQGASIKTLEIQIGQMSKYLDREGFWKPTKAQLKNKPERDQVKSILTSIKADSNSIRRIRSNQYAVSTGHNSTPLYKARQKTIPFPSHLDNHYCEEEGASVSVMPLSTYLNLGLGELVHTRLIVKLADKTVKYPKGIAGNLRERMELDLEARLMGETLDLVKEYQEYLEKNYESGNLEVLES
ncbi:hypothetical protein Tco_1068964 [Tanacetum coccineum]|uniref:Uncharacterized protein n=1 Tax=Tanacetum coccineum TaxID=301880 RepID=A0ABQ5HJ35_9ASTR